MLKTLTSKVLVVDDDDSLREIMTLILEDGGFQVRSASDVKSALKLITSQSFDVLISDLHMPSPGDGLTVVSAMRHSNADAITIIYSANPDMDQAAAAIVAQTDDVIMKPAGIGQLVSLVREKLEKGTKRKTGESRVPESAASVLEESSEAAISDWLSLVYSNDQLATVWLDDHVRSAHLPQIFHDLVFRLRHPHALGSCALISTAAAEYGLARREQGYTTAMMAEEFRILQSILFQTLHKNLYRLSPGSILLAVMEIADDLDFQLVQAMASYVARSKIETLPTVR